jgi:hypothetical protein
MNQNEIEGRLIVLEIFVITALALYLANSKNDPDYSKSTALLDHLRATSASNASAARVEVQQATRAYSDHLLSLIGSNLRQMRGEGGQPH